MAMKINILISNQEWTHHYIDDSREDNHRLLILCSDFIHRYYYKKLLKKSTKKLRVQLSDKKLKGFKLIYIFCDTRRHDLLYWSFNKNEDYQKDMFVNMMYKIHNYFIMKPGVNKLYIKITQSRHTIKPRD